jgi:hypothetical protein
LSKTVKHDQVVSLGAAGCTGLFYTVVAVRSRILRSAPARGAGPVRTGHGRSDGETRLLLRVPYVPPTRARSLFSLSLLHSMSLPRTRGVRPAEATSDMIRVDSARPRVAVRDTTRAPSLLDGPAWASHTPSPIATFGISLQSTGVPIPACAFALPRCPSTERRDHVAWAQPPCFQRVLFASHSARERS